MRIDFEPRRAACRHLLQRQGLGGAYFTLPASVRYLSGYAGGDAGLLVAGKKTWLVTDSRYQEEARKSAPDCELVLWTGSMAGTAAQIFAGLKTVRAGSKLGVEADVLPLAAAAAMRRHKVSPVPLGPDFSALRQAKDAAEIAAARRSIRVAEAAFRELKPRLRAGMKELEIKAELEWLAMRHGAEGMSFPTIVAVGANSSLPHAQAGRRALRPGVPLLIDFGVFVDGYASDLTRTLFLGHAPKVWRERYQAVLEAQAAGLAAIRAGASGAAVDAAAREVLSQYGLAERFIHSLGHGFGLEIHEAPRLSRLGGPLPLNSLVTVEPGVYFPGQGGIRIEDDVRVLAGRGEVMSTLARDLDANVI